MKVISLGMGMQSTAMYLMSCLGEIERADYAVFADPGAEHPKTHEITHWLLDWADKNDGIPIKMVQGYIADHLLNWSYSTGQRFASIPAFTGNQTGMIRRQCTMEYKIAPVIKEIRKLHGLEPRKRMKPTDIWIGITIDEATRMKDSQHFNITNKYPLIDKMMSRGDCINWLKSHDFPLPVKSSCIFCPYQSDNRWRDLKKNWKESWELAVKIDDAIRDSSKKGLTEPIYLHRSCKPISEIDFGTEQLDMFGEECEGYCGL